MTTNTAEKLQTKVITGKVRGSYVKVFKAELNDLSGNMEFSMQLLIPKTDKQTVGAIQGAIKAALSKKFNGKAPNTWRNPLRDGDTETRDDGSPMPDAYKGHFFVNVKSKEKPGIVDANRNDVIDSNAFMSGDYCRVSMNAYGYDQKGNKGVAFGLQNVQVLAKGEPLGGRSRAEDEFDDWEDDGNDDFMG